MSSITRRGIAHSSGSRLPGVRCSTEMKTSRGKPERLVGDSAYGAAPMLNWLVEEKGITPHIPVFDRSKRDDGTFSRSDFRYDPTSDVYHCPGGKLLGTSGTVHEGPPRPVRIPQAMSPSGHSAPCACSGKRPHSGRLHITLDIYGEREFESNIQKKSLANEAKF